MFLVGELTVKKIKRIALNQVSIRTQLLVLATTVIFATISIITIFNYSRSSNLIIEQMISTNSALLSLEGPSFTSYLSDLDNYSLALRNDSAFMQKVSSLAPFDFLSSSYVQSLLKNTFYSRNDIKSYKLYLINQDTSYTLDSSSMQIKIKKGDVFSKNITSQCTKPPYYRYIKPSSESGIFMMYYRTIIDVANKTPLAIVELSINMNYINSLSETHKDLNNCFCIFDNTGICFYSNEPDIIKDEQPNAILSTILSGGKNYYTSTSGLRYLIVKKETNGFYLVTLTPTNRIMESLAVTRNISFALGLFSILISIALFTYSIRMITLPLSILASQMKEAGKGDFSLKENLTGSSEIYHLTKRYNSMLKEIDDLIKRNYIAKYNEERAKLIALEAQVNPHFINNTLQTIATEAIVNHQSKIYDMIIALATMQRYALKGPEMVLVETEIENVQKYLFLQKSRLGNSLEYCMDIEDTLLEQLIPKLSIMTLVENSIIHGISGNKSSISIRICICIENGYLRIEASDTGAGINKARLYEIEEKLKSDGIDSENKQFIGLLNLNSRLRILYNDNANLIINSTENIGTTVILYIPVKGVNFNV